MIAPTAVLPRNINDTMSPEEVRGVVCDPRYPLSGLSDPEGWVVAASALVRKEGLEQFLVNMLHVLGQGRPLA